MKARSFSLQGTSTTATGIELPATMSPSLKVEYSKICDKGKTLYDINCGGCHTTIERDKEIIPDFSPEQTEAYQIRVLNSKHENSIPETTVSTEKLGLILVFFKLQEKNKVVVKK
jgi:predicted transcriptional regulator